MWGHLFTQRGVLQVSTFESSSPPVGCVTLDRELTSLSLLRSEEAELCAWPLPGVRDAVGDWAVFPYPVARGALFRSGLRIEGLRELLSARYVVGAKRSGKSWAVESFAAFPTSLDALENALLGRDEYWCGQ